VYTCPSRCCEAFGSPRSVTVAVLINVTVGRSGEAQVRVGDAGDRGEVGRVASLMCPEPGLCRCAARASAVPVKVRGPREGVTPPWSRPPEWRKRSRR